ncbi:MAG: zinc ribbon domain-containing protein [Lachnospiraceae bacterium]|nr:zinc ribbon domain-containing protein [Lachnospiraceae bacterium]
MSVFCTKCGTPILEDSLFCPKCGARQELAAPAQPQAAPQMPQQQQAPFAGQQIPQQQQPKVPQQQVPPQPVQMQPQTPPRQPQYQQPQQYQAQPQQQPQQQFVQQQYQQPQFVQQPQRNQQQYQQPSQYQAQPQYALPPKKKSRTGLIVGLSVGGGALLLLLLLGIFVLPNLFKDVKRSYAENVVGMAENISDEVSDFGSSTVNAILHLSKDETKDSHTTFRTTTIETNATDDQSLELQQIYSYDASSGDASYEISIKSEDTTLGSTGMYFHGDEFIYSPLDPSNPMVRYEMDPLLTKALKGYDVVDKYALMLLDEETFENADWNAATDDFYETALADLDKERFVKDKEVLTILGNERKCDTISLTVDGAEAENLLEAFKDLLKLETTTEETEEQLENYGDIVSQALENSEEDEITLTTFSYKKKPVALRLSGTSNGQNAEVIISSYRDGDEKQFLITAVDESKEADNFTFEDSIITNGGKTVVKTYADLGDGYFLIEETGKVNGDDRDLTGTITIAPGSSASGSIPINIKEDVIEGNISRYLKNGSGENVTEFETEEGNVRIVTTISKENLDEDHLNPPMFLEESGTDCKDDLVQLTEVLEMEKSLSLFDNSNSVMHQLGAILLLMRNSGIGHYLI